MYQEGLSLWFDTGAQPARQAARALLALNERTEARGLRLSEGQALELVAARTEALAKTGRIEFGGGAIERLILAFCDSPYLSRDHYAQSLRELIDLFYEFKNETLDRISDQELVGFMVQAFDGPCAGSVDLLAGQALPALARHLRDGKSFSSFLLRGEEWA